MSIQANTLAAIERATKLSSMRWIKADGAAKGPTFLESCAIAYGIALITLSIVWPRYGFVNLGGGKSATPFTVLAIASWALLPILLIASGPVRSRLAQSARQRWPVLLIFAAWIAWRGIPSFQGEQSGMSIPLYLRDVFYFTPLIPFTMLVASTASGSAWLIRALVFSTGVVLVAAIPEWRLHTTLFQLMHINFTGVQDGVVKVGQVREGGQRIASVFEHSIIYGQYLSWATPIMVFAAVKDRSRLIRIAAVGCLILIPLAVYLSGSRAALATAVVAGCGLPAMLLLKRIGLFSPMGLFGTVAALSIAFAVIGPGAATVKSMITGHNHEEALSTKTRTGMFYRAINASAQSPIMGFGAGRAPYHAGARDANGTLTIDSYYLSALLESGYVGLVLQAMALWIPVFFAVKTALSRTGSMLDAALAPALAAVGIGFITLSTQSNITLVFISAGLIGTQPMAAAAAKAAATAVAGNGAGLALARRAWRSAVRNAEARPRPGRVGQSPRPAVSR